MKHNETKNTLIWFLNSERATYSVAPREPTPFRSRTKKENTNYASAYFGPNLKWSQFGGYLLPSFRLGSSFSRYAPTATKPEV